MSVIGEVPVRGVGVLFVVVLMIISGRGEARTQSHARHADKRTRIHSNVLLFILMVESKNSCKHNNYHKWLSILLPKIIMQNTR